MIWCIRVVKRARGIFVIYELYKYLSVIEKKYSLVVNLNDYREEKCKS
jgi:hypothetical protein